MLFVYFFLSFFISLLLYLFTVVTVPCIHEHLCVCVVWCLIERVLKRSFALQFSRVLVYHGCWCCCCYLVLFIHNISDLPYTSARYCCCCCCWTNCGWHCQWNMLCKQSFFSFQSIVSRWMIKTYRLIVPGPSNLKIGKVVTFIFYLSVVVLCIFTISWVLLYCKLKIENQCPIECKNVRNLCRRKKEWKRKISKRKWMSEWIKRERKMQSIKALVAYFKSCWWFC